MVPQKRCLKRSAHHVSGSSRIQSDPERAKKRLTNPFHGKNYKTWQSWKTTTSGPRNPTEATNRLTSVYSWKATEVCEKSGGRGPWCQLRHISDSAAVGLAWKVCSLAVKGTDVTGSRGQKTHARKRLQVSWPKAEVPEVVADSGGTGRNLKARPGNERGPERCDEQTTCSTHNGHSRRQAYSKPRAALQVVWILTALPTQTQTQRRGKDFWAKGVWPQPLTTNYTDPGVTSAKSRGKSR